MKYFIFFTTVLMAQGSLLAMEKTEPQLSQLSKLILQIENGDLSKDAPTASRIISELTEVAHENPSNLIARGYLWMIAEQAAVVFKTPPKKLITGGKAQVMVEEFEYAPEAMRGYIKENFLSSSAAIASFTLGDPNRPEQTKRYILAETSSFISFLVNEDSVRGASWIHLNQNRYKKSLFEKRKEKATSILQMGAQFQPLFSDPSALLDGKAEFDAINKFPKYKNKLLMLSAALGYEPAIRELLLMLKLEDQRENFCFYARKGMPWVALLAGLKGLAASENQSESTSFMEYYLALPETNWQEFIQSAKKYPLTPDSIHFLTLHYLAQKNIEEAQDVLIKAWRKGFVPSPLQRKAFAEEHETKELAMSAIEKIKSLRNEMASDSSGVKASLSMNHLLALLYSAHSRGDFEWQKSAKKYVFACLEGFQALTQKDKGLENEVQLSLGHILQVLGSDDHLLPDCEGDRDKLRLTLLSFKNTVESNLKDNLGDYNYLIFILNSTLLSPDNIQYLKQAADNGHEKSIYIHTYYCFTQLFDNVGSTLAQFGSAMSGMMQNMFIEQPVEKAVEEPVSKKSDFVPKKESSSLVPEKTSREQAMESVSLFISKWENTSWKGSSLKELKNDFRKLVLNNERGFTKNSSSLHQTHGRRRAKYGPRTASPFEIKTMIELAKKRLETLRNQA